MEDVLDVYDPQRPLVCLDEASRQLIGEAGHPVPTAERVVLVVDNLNTHKPASLDEAFPPEQARQIAERVDWHYTPKPGSWEEERNERGVGVKWRFTTADARIQFHKLYPTSEEWWTTSCCRLRSDKEQWRH